MLKENCYKFQCYKGNWLNGEMHDYGEYIWNSVKSMNFYFPIENVYRGNWKHGLRDGIGIILFNKYIKITRHDVCLLILSQYLDRF